FYFNPSPTPEISTLPLHDALPISHAFAADYGEHSPADGVQPHAAGCTRAVWEHRRGPRNSAPERAEDYCVRSARRLQCFRDAIRSEEHTSELQSRGHLVCRLLLEK